MSAAERLLYFFGPPLVRCFYRVTPLGLENLPAGGFLLVPNHISWVDALILQLACPRPIRYVIDQEYYHKRMLHPILRAIGCIPISKRQSHAAVRVAAEKIAEGEIVCVFPEGELERRGTLLRLQRGYEVIARHAKAEVVPVWLDQLWGSIFSFQGGKFFRKFPKRIRYPVTVAFGKPLEAKAADVATVREELLKLGEFCFSRRPSLNRHLAEDCVRQSRPLPVKRQPGRSVARRVSARLSLRRNLRETNNKFRYLDFTANQPGTSERRAFFAPHSAAMSFCLLRRPYRLGDISRPKAM